MKFFNTYMFRSIPFYLSGLVILSACGTTTSTNGDFMMAHTYLLRDDGDGGKIYNDTTWGNYSDVVSVTNRYCVQRGFREPIITDPYRLQYSVKHYEFKCSKPQIVNTQIQREDLKPEPVPQQNLVVPEKTQTTPEKSPTVSIAAAKQKCSELGFTANTARFGKCVLQLTK